MPNWCTNCVTIYAKEETIEKIRNFVCSEESAFDFNNIIPMPEHIYTGILVPEEREKYGKDNWYDWSNENWGTKWNSESSIFEDKCISFESAWSPASPVIAKLASMFPDAEFWYQYEEVCIGFCGAEFYKNGTCVYEMSADISRNHALQFPECFDREEYGDYAITDELYPIMADGIYVDAGDDGSIHIREYREGMLYECIDGEYEDHRSADDPKAYWNEEIYYHPLAKVEA